MNELCWSSNGELFQEFDYEYTEKLNFKDYTEEEIARQIMKGYDYNKIYIGESVPVTVDNVLGDFGEDVIERISELAWDNHGEVAEDYLCNVPNEQINDLDSRLNKVIKEWLIDNKLEPTFYKVINVRSYREYKRKE